MRNLYVVENGLIYLGYTPVIDCHRGPNLLYLNDPNYEYCA